MEQPRCSECHRPLSDPKSIARGIGPVCWRKLQAEGGITIPTRTVRIPSKRKDRNPQLTEKLVEVNQRLDLFINVRTEEGDD